MITREPGWRIDKNKDWGLFPIRKTDYLKDFLLYPKFLYILINGLNQKRRINKCLEKFEKKQISLGSGSDVPDGWIGFDGFKSGRFVFPVNLLFELPLDNNSIHEILAEHILEHFYFDDLYRLLTECHRVLKPGGKIRIICPNGKYIAELLLKGRNSETEHDLINDSEIHHWPDDGLRWVKFINRLTHQWGQHKSLLTQDMLTQLLEHLGFDQVFQVPVKESKLFDKIPDIHYKRFPNDGSNLNFAVEAMVNKKER